MVPGGRHARHSNSYAGRQFQLQGLVAQAAACLIHHIYASHRAGRVSENVLDPSTTEGTTMKHRLGILTLLMGVGAGIAAGLIWKFAEPAFSVPSLLRGRRLGVGKCLCVASHGF